LPHLVGPSDETGAQPTIRHRVVLETPPLLEFSVCYPVLIVAIPGRPWGDVGDACLLPSRLLRGVAHDGIRGNAERQGWQLITGLLTERVACPLAATTEISDFRRNDLRRIAVH